jgi:hypothetical protein
MKKNNNLALNTIIVMYYTILKWNLGSDHAEYGNNDQA